MQTTYGGSTVQETFIGGLEALGSKLKETPNKFLLESPEFGLSTKMMISTIGQGPSEITRPLEPG